MRTNKPLTQGELNGLLAWLDPDREKAARKYEEIRKILIQIFTWRNFSDAEDLADGTIDRVARKVGEIVPHYKGDPALYFHGVAKLMMLEEARNEKLTAPLEPRLPYLAVDEEGGEIDVKFECLGKCLDELPPRSRELVVNYYIKERQTKIDNRKAMAERLGMTANSLRVRVHRLRADLESCVEKCVAAHSTGE